MLLFKKVIGVPAPDQVSGLYAPNTVFFSLSVSGTSFSLYVSSSDGTALAPIAEGGLETTAFTRDLLDSTDATAFLDRLMVSADIMEQIGVNDALVNKVDKLNPSSTGNMKHTGPASFSGDVYTGAAVEINGDGVGNRVACIDFHGDDVYTDWGARLIRNDTGPDAATFLSHRGLGNLALNSVDGGAIAAIISGKELLRVRSNGDAFIGSGALGFSEIPGRRHLRVVNTDLTDGVNATGSSIVAQVLKYDNATWTTTRLTVYSTGDGAVYADADFYIYPRNTAYSSYVFTANSFIMTQDTNESNYIHIGPRQFRRNYTNNTFELVNSTNTRVVQELPDTGGLISHGEGKIGYGSASGGSVTQSTSKATTVTLDAVTGEITTAADALAAGATTYFRVNCNKCTVYDLPIVRFLNDNGAGYRVECSSVGAGFFHIRITNLTAGALSQAIRIRFLLLQGSIS